MRGQPHAAAHGPAHALHLPDLHRPGHTRSRGGPSVDDKE
jgi:hypothetical protein